MQRTPVTSSNVVSVGYDNDNQVLEVEFKSGVYRYSGVPAQVHADLMISNSKGQFINKIKGSYPFQKVA